MNGSWKRRERLLLERELTQDAGHCAVIGAVLAGEGIDGFDPASTSRSSRELSLRTFEFERGWNVRRRTGKLPRMLSLVLVNG